MNDCKFSGWITHEPEYGQTNAGKTYCNFSMGILEKRYSDKQKSTFLKFVAYGVTADNLKKRIGKGSYLVINDSSAQNNDYINKQTGEKRYETRYNVLDFEDPSAFKGGSSENIQAEREFSEVYASDESPLRKDPFGT